MNTIGAMFALFFSLNALQGDAVQEQLQVVFRDIRVHVTDKDGNPVFGLEPGNFQVKEDGVPQTIGYFEEVDLRIKEPRNFEYFADEEGSGEGTPGKKVKSFGGERNIVIVLDSSNMRLEAFPEFKEVVKDFIDRNLREEDLVKIVQVEDRLIHLSPFLRSKSQLFSSLEKAEYKGWLYNKLAFHEREVVNAFEQYVSVLDPEEKEFHLYSLRNAITFKEMDKTAHFKTLDFSLNHLARVFDQMTGSKSVYLFTGGGFINRKGFTKTTKSLAAKLGRALNSSNATVYSFLHIPKESIFEKHQGASPISLQDELNPFQELGPQTQLAIGTVLEDEFNLLSAPLEISESTGGFLETAHSVSNIQEAFQEFNRRVQHYYRLGYTLEAPKGRTKLKISLVNKEKGWKLHYGKELNPIKPYLKMDEEERAVSFEAALQYSMSFRNDLDCEWGFTGFKADGRGETVPVYINLKTDRFPEAGYEIGFAALNDQRDLIDSTRAVVQNRSGARDYMFYDVLLPKSKPFFIRYQIIDLSTGARSLFELPYRRNEVNVGPVVFGGMALAQNQDIKFLPMNQIRHEAEGDESTIPLVGLRKYMDPFALENAVFIPGTASALDPAKPINLFFQLRNVEKAVTDYSVNCKLEREGEPKKCSLEIQYLHKLKGSGGIYHCSGVLTGENLAAGRYKLYVWLEGADRQVVGGILHEFEMAGAGGVNNPADKNGRP